jgi:vitamin B12 transporter
MVFLFAAALAAVSTATPSPSPSPSLQPIAHVTTSDRGNESATRAARTTYVVTAADMARDGDRTVADALENVPGVDINRYGAFGAQTSFGIRGSSSAQVLVLLDGLPIAGAQIQNVQLEGIPVSGIDRVEVVEGGGSTLYGSGSIGGVINIISAQPATTAAVLSTGSFGEQSYQFQTPYVSFQRTYATNDFGLPDGTTRQNANAGLTAGRVAYEHTFGAWNFSFTGDLSQQGVRTPGSLDFSSATSFQTTNANDLRLRIENRHPHSTMTVSLGESTQDLSYNCNTPDDTSCPNEPFPAPSPGAPTPPPYQQYLYDTRVMASANNSVGDDKQRLVYGVDLSRGIARIDGGTGDPPAVANAYAQTAAYAQQQWFGTNGNELYIGLRGENNYMENSGAGGSALSPSIGGILKLEPTLSLRLNAATAFRAPDAEDLFYPFFSNPNLVPERTRVGDATLTDSALFGGVSLGWFTTAGTDLITFDNVSFIPENVGKASIAGFTLTANSRPYHGLVATLAITNLYSAQDLDTNPAVDPYSGQRLPDRGPVFATTLGATYSAPARSRFDGFGVKITNWGQQSPEATEPYYAQAAAFTTTNAYVGYRITPKTVLTLRGNNLLGARYAYYNGFPMPGPSYTLELRSR